MKIRFSPQILLAAIIACFLPVSIGAASANPARQELAADAGWKFFLGDPSGAEASSFSDVSWRVVNLPHDWSIESKPDKDNPSGSLSSMAFTAMPRFISTGTNWGYILMATQRLHSTSRPSSIFQMRTCWPCVWITRHSQTVAGTAGRASTGMSAWS